MRPLMLIVALATSTSALAGGLGKCAYPFCPGVQIAVEDALAEQGLFEPNGYTLHEDAAGQRWLTILSDDAEQLDRIAPRSGARTLPIPETATFARTVPLDLTDIDAVPIPSPVNTSDVTLKRGSIGSGGGNDECYESCVCTEDGIECWLECP